MVVDVRHKHHLFQQTSPYNGFDDILELDHFDHSRLVFNSFNQTQAHASSQVCFCNVVKVISLLNPISRCSRPSQSWTNFWINLDQKSPLIAGNGMDHYCCSRQQKLVS